MLIRIDRDTRTATRVASEALKAFELDVAILSSVTAAEVEQASEQVKAVHAELIDGGGELLPVLTESIDLLNKYVERKILGPKFQNEMLYIAFATMRIEKIKALSEISR